jgi:hypothetical protein
LSLTLPSLHQTGNPKYRLVMNGLRSVPIPGMPIKRLHFASIARINAGVVLAHLLLMASGSQGVASDETSHLAHLAAGDQIEPHTPEESGNSSMVESSDHLCSPFAGDIARNDPVWIRPKEMIASISQEHVQSLLEYSPLEPNPPDRSQFQVFLN